jgi:hypothetical protein
MFRCRSYGAGKINRVFSTKIPLLTELIPIASFRQAATPRK